MSYFISTYAGGTTIVDSESGSPVAVATSKESAEMIVNALNASVQPQPQAAWGDVEVGDRVTSRGRHGAGQPAIEGDVISVTVGGGVFIRCVDGSPRYRSINNVRKVS